MLTIAFYIVALIDVMLGVVMLSVVMLNIAAHFIYHLYVCLNSLLTMEPISS
jgi:hypothetical protein